MRLPGARGQALCRVGLHPWASTGGLLPDQASPSISGSSLRTAVGTVCVHLRDPPESPSRPAISREATLPQVVLPVLWAGLCPSPEAHVNLQTSECGRIRGRDFADMIRPRSMTRVLVSRDQDADTRKDPCGPHEDPGRRRPSTWPGEASGGTGPATLGWGVSSLQDVRAHSRCVRLLLAVRVAPGAG